MATFFNSPTGRLSMRIHERFHGQGSNERFRRYLPASIIRVGCKLFIWLFPVGFRFSLLWLCALIANIHELNFRNPLVVLVAVVPTNSNTSLERLGHIDRGMNFVAVVAHDTWYSSHVARFAAQLCRIRWKGWYLRGGSLLSCFTQEW